MTECLAKCQWCGGPMNDCSGLFVAVCMDCKREVAPWPKPLKWTDKKPTEPGLYAYLSKNPAPKPKRGRLRRIEADARGKLWIDYGCAGPLTLADCDDGLWLGPLPEIPETQEEDAQTAERS